MDETPETLLNLTADIVVAHVSNNSVPVSDLSNLISKVHSALAGLGSPVARVAPTLAPAVTIRASVKRDAITCLICGKKLKLLKRHLSKDHGQTPEQYRAQWSLPSDYPMVAPDYAATRRNIALETGLGKGSHGRWRTPRR